MSDGTMELATAYFEMIPSMAGAEAAITSELAPASAAAGAAAGIGIGGTLLAGLKKFAGPIALIAAGFSIAKIVKSSTEAFDNLAESTKTLQRVAGGTAEQVSGLAGGMKLAGLDSNKAQTALTVFSKNLGNATKSGDKTTAMIKSLGGNFLDATGQVKPMADIMPILADRFQSMPNGAQKTALAMQLFGRSGAQMIPFLNNGAAGIADFTGQAKQMGLVLTDQSMNLWWNAQLAAKRYTAAITGTKAALGQDLAPAMEAIAGIGRSLMTPILTSMTAGFNKLLPAVLAGSAKIDAFGDKVGDAVKQMIDGFTHGTDAAGSSQTIFASWGAAIYGVFAQVKGVIGDAFSALRPVLAQLGPVFKALVPQVLGLLTAFSPLHLIFTALLPVLPQLISILGTFVSVIGNGLAKVLAMVLPPITKIASMLATGLTKAILMLLPIVTMLAQVIGTSLANEMTQLAPIIGQIAAVLGDTLGTVIKQLMPIVALVAQVFGQVLQALMPLIPALLPLVNAVLSLIAPLLQLIGPILTPLIQLFTALISPILKLVAPLINMLLPILQPIIDLLTMLANVLSASLSGGIKIVSDLLSGNFTGAMKDARSMVSQMWGDITGFFTKAQADIHAAMTGIGSFFAGIWNSMITNATNQGKAFAGFILGLPGQIMNGLKGAGTWLVDIGKNMIQGLLNGAGSLLRNIGTFFLKIIPSWIVAPFKAALGIHSPSTVFAELGGYITQGLIVGVTGGQGAVQARMSSLVSVPALAGIARSSSTVGVAAAGAAPVYVQNPFTGEYLLSKVDDRATKVVNDAAADDDATVRGGTIR